MSQSMIYSGIITTFFITLFSVITALSLVRRMRIMHTQVTPDFTRIAHEHETEKLRITQTMRTVNLDDVDETDTFVITIEADEDTVIPETNRYHQPKHIVNVMKKRAEARAS